MQLVAPRCDTAPRSTGEAVLASTIPTTLCRVRGQYGKAVAVAHLAHLRAWAIILVGAVLSLAVTPLPADTTAAGTVQKLQTLRRDIATLQQRLLDDANSAQQVQGEIYRIEQRLGEIRSEQGNTPRRVQEKSERVAALKTRVGKLELSVAAERERFNRALRARYMLWRQPAIKVFLNQENIHALSRNRYFYDHLMVNLRTDLREALNELRKVGDLKTVLALETNRLKTLQFQATLEQQTLEETLTARGQIIARLETALGETESLVARLKNDEIKLQILLEKLEQSPPGSATESRPFGSLAGQLPWPASGKVVTAPGTAVRDGGAKWAGVVIQAPSGANVRAIAAGRIAFADWFRNLGLLVIIDHQGGHMSLYGYNRDLKVSRGDWVEQNRVIATVGDTGGRSSSGLYFEIRSEGQPLDPRRWCAKLD